MPNNTNHHSERYSAETLKAISRVSKQMAKNIKKQKRKIKIQNLTKKLLTFLII